LIKIDQNCENEPAQIEQQSSDPKLSAKNQFFWVQWNVSLEQTQQF